MKKGLLILVILLVSKIAFSQSTIYSTDFGTGVALPAGWTTSSTKIVPNSTNPSSVYLGASGSGNLLFKDIAPSSLPQVIIINPGINTLNYTNIKFIWGASTDVLGNFPTPFTFEWSIDGITWSSAAFSDITFADGKWYQISQYTLPIGAEGKANLQFRITFTNNALNGIYQMDDFIVSGTGTGNFYSKATGNLDLLSTWGTNTDGTGTSPTNFTSNSQTFNVVNNTNATIGANWVVSGSGATVVVQNGTNFTIPATFSLTTSGGSTVNVLNGGTLTLQNTSVPSLGTLQPTSTINYNGPSSVFGATYGNLTISTASSLGGAVSVNGILSLNTRLTIGNNTLTLNGDMIGAGDLRGSTLSNLTINGSGNLTKSLLLGGFGGTNLGSLTINRASSGVVSLSSSPTINTQLVLNAGILNLNSVSLTLASSNIVNGGGVIRGGATSNIIFNGSGTGGTLVMDNSSPANSTLSNLSTNRDVSLGSDLIVAGTLTLNTGTYNFTVGANTLTLNGNNISIASPANFLTSSSSSLVFGGSSAGVNIPSSVSNLNNLTIGNSAATGVITNSNITVGGSFTLNGNITLSQNFNLTFNGPVVNTSGLLTIASGSTSTNVTYGQGSNGQNVITANYLNLTFNNFNKVLPSSGIIGISGAFTTGTATGHTITGSKFSYNGAGAQTISAFNYNDLDIAGSGRSITFANGTIGVANNFTTSSNTFTVGTSTLDFNGLVNQTIPNIPLYNLNVSNGGIKSLSSSVNISNDLTIASLVTLNTTISNYAITIAGNFINNGIFSDNSSNVTFNASTSKSIQGSSSSTFYDLTVSTSGASSTLFNESDVSVKHALNLPLGTSSIDVDGASNNKNFRLISNASGDAFIANIPSPNGSTIIGSLNAQRYLANPIAMDKFRYLTSPVLNATVSQIQDTIPVTGGFANPTFGTYNGTTLHSSYSSLYYYNESFGTPGKDLSEGYVGYPGAGVLSTDATNALLKNGTGYSVLVRMKSSSQPNVTLNLKGTPAYGTVSIPISYTVTSQLSANDGWNLLGNPYAAPIDWRNVTLTGTGLNDAIYLRDNTNVGGGGAGNSVAFVGKVGTGGFNGILASGQAFYVQATSAGSGSLVLNENVKNPISNTFYRTSSINNNLIRITIKGNNISDDAVVYFDENATDKFDGKFDAYKFRNPQINISSYNGSIDSTSLAINGSPFTQCYKKINLAVGSKLSGSYKLDFTEFENFDNNIKITLLDSISNKVVDVRTNNSYSFEINNILVSQEKTRFKLIFERDGTAPTITLDGLTLISNNKFGNQWIKNGQPIAGATSNTYLVTQDGTYSVLTKYQNGCAGKSTERQVAVTGIENNIESGIKIFPNPIINDLNISYNLKNNNYLQASIFNMTGGMVFEKRIYPVNKSQFVIENLNLKSGTYILKLIDGNDVKFVKFIKE